MKLTIQQGKKDKIHILLDGEYTTTVDSLYFGTCGYRDGAEISEEELEPFLFGINVRRAFNKAANLLSYRDHSEKEILMKLRTAGFDDEASQRAIERLRELRMLDDGRFAEIYANELYRRKKFSRRRILQELSLKGIDRETAENAVDSLDIEANQCIIELLQTKFRGKFSDDKGKQRTVAALSRMGYSYSDIRSAMNEVGSEFDADEDM